MPELLFEIFSEEIPARMQAQAAKDLERLVVGALSDRGLLFEGAKAFAGPRRLTLAIAGLPAKQPDVSDEKKGPRVNAPQKAIEGFLRSAGVTLEECETRDDGKGAFYVAVINRQGRPTFEVLAEPLPEAMAKLPWPKSMRWGTAGQTRWVRPLHSIIATLDGEVIPFSFANVQSGNTTRGHRFLSSGLIAVKRFEDYEAALEKAHVVLDAERRKAIIFEELKQAAFVHGLDLIEDEALLNEVAGLAEWPVVLIGRIEDQFMDVPAEILQTSMRTHQKYFSLRDPKTGKMANRFAVIANMVAEDGGKEITLGNERVLRSRLSDAKFFWDQDRRHTLESRVEALKNVVFHAKLGTQYERVERIEALAGEIAEKIGADVKKAKRAARLCKADLTTGVVGEFPELQGVMGRYYALHDGEDAAVADAVRDHYKPVGLNDDVPTNRVSIAVALADKLDQLVCFFSIGEKPTGSGDPYALRRAALGLIRALISNSIRLPLTNLMGRHAQRVLKARDEVARRIESISDHRAEPGESDIEFRLRRDTNISLKTAASGDEGIVLDVLEFLTTRLSVALSSDGLRTDCVRAIFNNTGSLSEDEIVSGHAAYRNDDLVLLAGATRALQSFLKTDEGANLLAGYKRAANILRIEEKKDGVSYADRAKPGLGGPADERLWRALIDSHDKVANELGKENFVGAMQVMAGLRGPVNSFFEDVKINVDNPELRKNRLELLGMIRSTLHLVADFSKIEG